LEYFLLFLGGLIAFGFSTISGGGGAMLLVPFVSFFAPANAVAPIINIGNFIGRPARIFLFWQHIAWPVVFAYLPGALLGALIGGWLLKGLNLDWVQLLVGLFLISTLFQFKLGKKEQSFSMYLPAFPILGFFVAALSTVAGATGAVLNPFFINYGVTKERLVATKAFNSFAVALIQIPTYYALGLLSRDVLTAGLAIGAGAFLGNYLGKKMLHKMTNRQFLIWVTAAMVFAGVVMVVKAARNLM
jgi:uncharacterized membrane protein YfcA